MVLILQSSPPTHSTVLLFTCEMVYTQVNQTSNIIIYVSVDMYVTLPVNGNAN